MAVEVAPDYDVVLAPWPPGGEDLAERSALHFATSTLKDAIQPGASDTVIRRLGATAAAMVERYAPGARSSRQKRSCDPLCRVPDADTEGRHYQDRNEGLRY